MLNHLIYAIGFVYLFPFYYKEYKTYFRAFAFGVILSVIMFIPTGIVVRSIWAVDFNAIFIMNSIAHITIGGIMGLVMAFIFSFKNKKDDKNK